MTEISIDQVSGTSRVTSKRLSLYRFGFLAALAQILCLLLMLIVATTVGVEPATAVEGFAILQQDRVEGILRLDFASLINVALFTITSFAAYVAVREEDALYPALATGLVFVGVALAVALHSGLSLIYLSDQHAAATTAAGWWHSSGGLLAGVFLQGGTVLLSAVMLRSKAFNNKTAYAGVLANGLDFVHIFVGLILPGVAAAILTVGGVFYLAWYPLLARDFYRLSREGDNTSPHPGRVAAGIFRSIHERVAHVYDQDRGASRCG